MNRTLLRRVAIAAAALFGVLLVVAAVFTATFDVNRYKAQIADAVQERTGRTLRFDGDLSLSFFPRLGVKLPPTTLSEPRRDSVFARVQSAQASAALLPLLRGELVIDHVRIDGLQATVVRNRDGTTSIDDFIKPRSAATAPGKGDPRPAPAATIGGVQLRNADVTWRDVATGRTIRLQQFDLQAGRFAPGARMPIDSSASITVSEPPLAARLDVEAEVEWSEAGGVHAVRDLALKGDGTLRQQPLAVEAKAQQFVIGGSVVDIRGVKAMASARAEGGAPLELQLVAPRLEARESRAAGERVELAFVRRGSEPIEARVTIDGVRGTAARLEATAVKVTGSSRAGARSTRFDLATALVASVNDRSLKIERASGEILIEDPALGQKPVRLPLVVSGELDTRRESVALRFETDGEGLRARGRLGVNGFTTPRIGFDVDADHLDLDRYLAPRPEGKRGAAAPAATAPGASADAKVDFNALRGVSASGNVRVARLRARGHDLTDLRASVKSDDGRLEVAPLSLRIHGGSVSGRVALDARGNRVAASGMASGIQLRRLVADIGRRAAVEGNANGTFDLATQGGTVGQWKRALGGQLQMEVRDGALIGIDLADVIGTAAGFLQSRGRQTGALDENRRTPFSQLSATVRIKDGVATNDDLKARSPQLDIAGSGRLDIVSTELDYALRAQVLAGPATERSALRSLAGVTVPVRIAGPLERPSYSVDWGAVAADALLRRATGRAGAPSVDQVLEGLGDLLGRRKK